MLTGDIRACFGPGGIWDGIVPLRLRSRVDGGDLGRLGGSAGGGGVARRDILGLTGLDMLPLGPDSGGRPCELRMGDRRLLLWGGLRGGRRMPLERGGDSMEGLRWG